MKQLSFFVLILILFFFEIQARIVVNEVSQGPSGGKEYVELAVIGDGLCGSDCVDIRGWILDDNNGFFATGSGTGIANGAFRFSQHPQWACVKKGSLIVVYNNLDRNNNIPPDDPTDANNDCVYILPGNSSYLEHHFTQPDQASAAYPVAGWQANGNWNTCLLRNSDDTFQTVDPNNATQTYHAVSWGNNTLNTVIYFAGSATGLVYNMLNTLNNDPWLQGNWAAQSANTSETPGAPNNAANALWLSSFSQGCFAVPNPTGLHTWTGAVDSNWFNICNWIPASIPQITNPVLVPGATPHQPVIEGDTAHCSIITIEATNGALLKIKTQLGGFLLKQP